MTFPLGILVFNIFLDVSAVRFLQVKLCRLDFFGLYSRN